MAVRQRLSGLERRALILDAAAEEFGRRGFEATRMEDVAERAGVAKGLLYKHFPSKDALFEALADEQGRRFAAELADAMRPDGGRAVAGDVLRRGLEVWVRQVADPSQVRFADPGTHDAYESVRNRAREIIAAVIRTVEPRTPEGPAWLVAAALQGAAESAGVAWSQRPSGLSPEQAAALLATFCWEGVRGLRRMLDGMSGDDGAPQPDDAER